MLLFIDDEPRLVDNFIFELQLLGVEVEFCPTVDLAVKKHLDRLDQFEGVICDVQMPHGSTFTADQTNGSRTTGLALLREIRMRSHSIRVVLLTNVDETFDAGAAIKRSAIKYAPCGIVRKAGKLTFEIAREVKDFFDARR